MKRIVLLAITAALIVVFTASCSSGISQEQYKKATDDLAAAQTQVQTLQTQNQTLQTQAQTLQTQIQDLQNQVKSLQSQTSASQADSATLADLQKKVNQAKPYWQLFTGFYQIGIAGQTPTAVQIMDMMGKIQATGDSTLTAKMQAIISSNGGKQESLDFVDYLIGKVNELLK